MQWRSTERALVGAAIRDTEIFATSYERYARRVIDDADRTARLVKFEFEQHGALDLSRLKENGLVEGSGLVVVSIADADGNIVASTQSVGPINIADRANFRLHADRDTGKLDISKPITGRSSGAELIQLSRRMNRRDGSFAGVVLLSVTPAYFMEFRQEADLGRQGRLGLLGLDGIYRAHSTGTDASPAPEGSGAQLAARTVTQPTGHFEAAAGPDRALRIVAYRKLADYPLIVTAEQTANDALVDFYRGRNVYLYFAAAATLAIVLFFGVVTTLAVRLQRHRIQLKDQRRFLETLVDNVPSGIAVNSLKAGTTGQYVLWSESNALICGTRAEDALGRTVREVLPADYADYILDLDRQLLASPMVQEVEQVRDLPEKGRRIFHLVRAPIFGADGAVDFIMTSTTDITEARAHIDDLRLASKVFETTADGIMLSDADDRVVMINAAFSRLTGYDEGEIVGTVLAESPFRPIDPVESDARMERLHRDGHVTGEVSRFRKDGTPLALWVTASCVYNGDGTIRNYVRVFTDISLLSETQRKLEQLATIDTLTELPNRRLLQDRLDRALLRADRHRVGMGLMFIDLDGFKSVNDTLGHDVGDLLLREVARRLSGCVRASDTIGRFGGDEFAIILEDAVLPTDAAWIAERIIAALAAPFQLAGHCVRTSASIGIAIYPSDGADAAALLRSADMAMYRSKKGGRNRFRFFAEADGADAPIDQEAFITAS
jgi:diguanylate cyclase (GGDEF)-like protein/PAS domain S-box-containing protein